MKPTWTLMAACAALVACATKPLTVDALRQAQSAASSTCSPLAQAVAVSRLKQAWENCKVMTGAPPTWIAVGKTGLPVYGTSGMSVGVEDSSAQTALVLRSSGGEVLALADFKGGAGGSCKTLVTTRARDASWAGFAAYTAQWLEDPKRAEPGCNG